MVVLVDVLNRGIYNTYKNDRKWHGDLLAGEEHVDQKRELDTIEGSASNAEVSSQVNLLLLLLLIQFIMLRCISMSQVLLDAWVW